MLAAVLGTALVWAQNSTPVSLETSETLSPCSRRSTSAANDQELDISDPLRAQVRSEVAKAAENTAGAQDAIGPMCLFYRQHQAPEAAHDLSHYVSLALYLGEPPKFTLKVREAELPPDADAVVGMVPLMEAFYQKIGLHAIWERHQVRYTELTQIYHVPLAKMTFDTEIFLKMPSSTYLGRAIHYLSGRDGRSRADQRAQLCFGLLRSHFLRRPARQSSCSRFGIPICIIFWTRWR